MQSRYRSVLETPLKAPEQKGTGRYEVLQGDAEATPGIVPPSTLPSYTQRTWKSGTYDGPGKRTTLGHGPSAGSGRAATSGSTTNARHRGKPPGLRPRSRGAGNSIGRSGGSGRRSR